MIGALLHLAVPALGTALLLRSAPFLGYALLGRRLILSVRFVAIGIPTLLFFATRWLAPDRPLRPLAFGCLGFVGLVACAATIHFVAPLLPLAFARSGAVFLLAFGGCAMPPIVLLRHIPSLDARVVGGVLVSFGWEAALRAHSYAVSVATTRAAPSFREATFALVVHPNVVYEGASLRTGPARVSVAAVSRIAIGAATMLGRDVAIYVATSTAWARWANVASIGDVTAYGRFLAAHFLLAGGLYAAHSGLASFHIGWMHLFGHELPERYSLPMLAVSPQDFWRRWNRWIGEWARRYLFVPSSLVAIRVLGGSLGASAGTLATFLGIGFLHDIGMWAAHATYGDYQWSSRMTAVFALFGVVFLAWRSAERIAQPFARVIPTRVRAVLEWSIAMQGLAWLAWLAVPVLRDGHFPDSIERALGYRQPG